MTTYTLSVTREVLRAYDQRFLDVERRERQRVVAATRGMLDGLLTEDLRRDLAEGERLRAFCIENDLLEELERLIADEIAGRKEGAVVVGGRVYAVYPYLRGVPRQDADITAEVGVAHRLDDLGWDKGRLRLRGWAGIARVQARDPGVELVLRDGDREHPVAVTPTSDGFEALVERPEPGSWTAHVTVSTLGVRRSGIFGSVRSSRCGTPKERDGISCEPEGDLVVHVGEAPAPRRRFWQLARARQARGPAGIDS